MAVKNGLFVVVFWSIDFSKKKVLHIFVSSIIFRKKERAAMQTSPAKNLARTTINNR
jgi:hypothetical protein